MFCDVCARKCKRRISLTVPLLEVPCYVCEGRIEQGLKGQRDTRVQQEQNTAYRLCPVDK